MRAKHDALVQALTGMFADHHGELAGLLLDQTAVLDARTTRVTILTGEQLAAIRDAWGVDADGTTGPRAGADGDAVVLPALALLDEIPGISPCRAGSPGPVGQAPRGFAA